MTIAPATMEEDEKPRTLLIGNLPRETHKREIENVFGEIGPLKRCYIQYPRDGNYYYLLKIAQIIFLIVY
jgi:RNA recognition motif-containing protein